MSTQPLEAEIRLMQQRFGALLQSDQGHLSCTLYLSVQDRCDKYRANPPPIASVASVRCQLSIHMGARADLSVGFGVAQEPGSEPQGPVSI